MIGYLPVDDWRKWDEHEAYISFIAGTGRCKRGLEIDMRSSKYKERGRAVGRGLDWGDWTWTGLGFGEISLSTWEGGEGSA